MIKKIYTPILVAAVALSAVADNSFFDGRRFDYLNEKGERLESLFPENVNWAVQVMMAHGSEENGYTTASCSGNPFAAMRVVPWGQES